MSDAGGNSAQSWLAANRRLAWVLGILCILLCGFLTFRFVARHAVKHEQQKIRDMGLPTTMAELEEWAEPIDVASGNAGAAVLTAIADLEANADAMGIHSELWDEWSGRESKPWVADDHRESLVAFSQLAAAELEALELALQQHNVRFEVDRTTVIPGHVDYSEHLLTGGEALSFRIQAAILLGDFETAYRGCIAVLDLAYSMRDESSLGAGRIRLELDQMAIESLQGIVRNTALTREQREEMVEALLRAESAPVVAPGLAGVICGIGLMFDNPTGVHGARGMTPLPSARTLTILDFAMGLHSGLGTLDVDHAFALQYLQDSHEIASTYVSSERIAKMKIAAAWRHDTVPLYYPISRFMLPIVDRILVQEATWLAKLRTAQKALNPGAALLDPFDGLDLKTAPSPGGGIRVYSIGQDFTDNGGIKDSKIHRWFEGDVYFEVSAKDWMVHGGKR